MALIRNIVVKVGADISGLSSGMTKAKASMEENVNKMVDAGKTLVLATAAAFTAVAAKGVEAASNLTEIQNVVDTAFGNSAAGVDAWAKKAFDAYGLNEESALKYSSTMRAMLGSMGVTSTAADTMSTSMAGLAGDIASFYNLDTDTAFEKIQAGIAGETKPLKDLGINMDVANLQAYALSQGITKSFASMSQGEQTLLRYNYLLNTTKMAQGDFAKTSGSYANQMRVFQARISELTVSLGQAVIPIIQAVLPWINMFCQYLINAATIFTKWIDGMLGIKPLTAAAAASTNALSSAASSTDAAAASSNNLANASTKAASGITKAAAAAKAAKSSISGLDQLNILQSQTTSTGSNGSASGTGGISGGGVSIPSVSIPAISIPKTATINVGIIGADKIEAFKKAVAAAWGWLCKYQDGIKAVASVITVFFLPAIVRSIAQLAISSAQGFIKGAQAVLEYGAAGWKALASTLANIEAWVIEKATLLEDISFKIEDKLATLAQAAATKIAAAAQYVMSGALWQTIAAWVQQKIQLIATVAQMIIHKGATLAMAAASKVATAGQWLLNAAMEANPIGLIIAAVVALIAVFVLLWNNNKGFRNFFINCWGGIKKIWGFVDTIKSTWNNVLKPFGSFMWDLFCTRFSSIFTFVKGIIGNIKTVFKGLTDFFSGVFTGNWSKAFKGLKEIAGGVFGGIVNIVKLPLNTLIGGINTVLKGVNGLAHVAANVPGLSWLKGVNIPQIPKLAQGGIIDKPTVAMIGEAGTEAVVPLQNTGFVNTLAAAVASAVAGGGKSGDINVTLQIDGNTFGKLCVKGINAQTRKLGVNPLYI